MLYRCFSLRPRVFHWNPPFSTRPRVFHQKACFSNSLFSTLRDSVARESGPRFRLPKQFRLLLDLSINVFMSICLKNPYFLKLQEFIKDWQKFTMKQSESCRTSFLLKVYQKWNQKHRCHTLNGLIRDSSRKPFQMYSPPRCYQPHKASSLSFKSRPGNLNAIISDHGYKFGPFVTKRQTYF